MTFVESFEAQAWCSGACRVFVSVKVMIDVCFVENHSSTSSDSALALVSKWACDYDFTTHGPITSSYHHVMHR